MNQRKSQKIKKKWGNDDIPDLAGKTIIVTGANSGIGFQTSKILASKGANVIMACRSLEKGAEAIHAIQDQYPISSMELMQLDLADLSSVRSFVEEFKENYISLEILINNAGVMQTPPHKTVDGFELQFGTNHLGHFALTGLLLEPLLQAKECRVVTMSSAAHSQGKIHFDDINLKKKYGRTKAYAQSKLANLLFAYELQRKFEYKGTSAISVGVHPGYSATNLQSAGPGMEGGRRHLARLYWISNKIFAQGVEMGALPLLCAATDSAIEGGDYIGPGRLRGLRGHPKKARSSKRSYNLEDANRLWELSEQMTAVKYELLA